MKGARWITAVLLVVAFGLGSLTTYLVINYEPKDEIIDIEDDGIPEAGSLFLNMDSRRAINALDAFEKDAAERLGLTEDTDINNAAMALARIERYGYLKDSLSQIVWNSYAGNLPSGYVDYFEEADLEDDALLLELEDMTDFKDPVTGEMIDFVHMVAVIDIFYSVANVIPEQEIFNDYLMSWGGDLETFAIDMVAYVDEEELTEYDEIYDYVYETLGEDVNSHFSLEDWLADIDGLNIANYMVENDMLVSDAIYNYYRRGIANDRYELFIESFGGQEAFREAVHTFLYSQVPEAYADDEDMIDFMESFGNFKSLMMMFMGNDVRDITEVERQVLEDVMIGKVLEQIKD